MESLARVVTLRVLGDPMQAIFDFKEPPVDWERDIYPHYAKLGELQHPWRWKKSGAAELGLWLHESRALIAANKKFSLVPKLPEGVRRCTVDLNDFSNPKRLNLFFGYLDHPESTVAIYGGGPDSKNKSHKLAQSLAGRFSSLEEMEGAGLHRAIAKIDGAKSPKERLLCVIEFLKSCCNKVDDVLAASTKRGSETKVTKATKCPEIAAVANRFLATGTFGDLTAFIDLIRTRTSVTTYRRDLLNRMLAVLRVQRTTPSLTLREAADKFQREFRYAGRPLRHNKLIGTTLLLKGLEYDHAIVLEPETMTAKDLYVAMTRGAKTVTFVTLARELPS